jgi:hypothetical protein
VIVCLLPARNAECFLPDWFASAGAFADAVIALDDGSTDATREMLAGHPLVSRVLVNPVRPGYGGWDDSANRTALLRAADDLSPRWIMQLDADELIPAADAAALRQFLLSEADPSCAYLFRVFNMVGDLEHYERTAKWYGRLFAYERGLEFPPGLHFVPVPVSIPRSRWVRTTVRIQHVGYLTMEQRRARYQKYLEADPLRRFQSSYEHLLHPPERVRRWKPRRTRLPVVVQSRRPADIARRVLLRRPARGVSPAPSERSD